MRIDELSLLAFGPFTQKRLDFSHGSEGLHLVFGPNEAGKSSALRALRDALFGIPSRSTDNFVHRHQDLRVGVTLRAADGSRLQFVRRKGNTKTLLDAKTEEPIAEARLTKLLSGVTREMYESMFGIDYASLVAGGQEIARLQGKVGETLFSAAGGITRLREVQQELERQGEELFKSGGSRPKLNAAIRDYSTTVKSAKEQRVPSKEYDAARAALAVAQQTLAATESQWRDVRVERDRLDALAKGLPQLAQRRQTLEQLAVHSQTMLLRSGFDTEFRKARESLLLAEERHRKAQAELTTLEEQCRPTGGPTISATLRTELRALSDALGSYRKAKRDLPGLVQKLEAVRAEAQTLLRRLRPGMALEDVESLRVSSRERAKLTELADEHTVWRTSRQQTIEALHAAQDRLAQAERDLLSLGVVADLRALQSTVSAIQELGPLEQRRQDVQRKQAREMETLQVRLQQLGRWDTSLDLAERAALPSLATISLHEQQIAEAERRVAELRDAVGNLERERRDLARQVETLIDAAGDLPTEGDLTAARQRRESWWRVVRTAWETGRLDTTALPTTAGESGGKSPKPDEAQPKDVTSVDVANGYERRVAEADETVDRLRREQERVAQRAQWEREIARRDASLAELAPQVVESQAELARRRSAWTGLWSPLNIEAGTPVEMRDWRGQIEQIRSQLPTVRALESESLELAQQATEALQRLTTQLELSDQPPLAADTSLKAAVQHCRELLADQESRLRKQSALQAQVEECRRQVQSNEKKRERLDAANEVWREAWTSSVGTLGFDSDATPGQVQEYLKDVDSLLERTRELFSANGISARIDGIQKDAAEFAGHVRKLASELGIAPTTLAPEKNADVADDLAQRVLETLQDAEQAEKALAESQRRRNAALEASQLAEAAVREARIRLQSLCDEAGGATAEQLDELWRRSEERRKLEAKRDDLEQSLLTLSGGRPLEEWEQEAVGVEASELARQIGELDARIESLDRQRGMQQEERGRLSGEFQRMSGGTQAVDLNATAQAQLARIETLAIDYARTRLAAFVLRKAIERFSEQNQGPLLRRASEFFRQLTEDSFLGLKVDYDEQDQPVLVGRRASATESVLGVEGMSEGTADQLYFAMRLAYLAEWQERHEPLPIVVDDVLIKFDDARALATLKVLADFSRRTQVIVFTHHEHLVDLATRHLPKEVVQLHRLAPTAPRMNTDN